MANNVLTMQEVKERFPDEWVLLVDFEQDESFAPAKGKVLAHSRRRSDIYRKLPDLRDQKFFILSTGEIPEDTGVLF